LVLRSISEDLIWITVLSDSHRSGPAAVARNRSWQCTHAMLNVEKVLSNVRGFLDSFTTEVFLEISLGDGSQE